MTTLSPPTLTPPYQHLQSSMKTAPDTYKIKHSGKTKQVKERQNHWENYTPELTYKATFQPLMIQPQEQSESHQNFLLKQYPAEHHNVPPA